jgi:Gas vesicle synthesis protein GvpL/GvpF
VTAAADAAALREEEFGWYLYGVVGADHAPPTPATAAVDQRHGVDVLVEGPLAGITSRVSLDEFDEAALPERLADAAWLEQKIRAHEQVLESVLERVSVVPCRFCTVYRTESDLRRFLAERGDALAEALADVRGRVELGVKAFVDRERFAAGEETLGEPRSRLAKAEGGRAYLEARRLERRVNEELARLGAELAGQLHTRLLAAAEDGVLLDLQSPELSGRDEEMFFNAAYLVEDRERFERELGALADEHRARGVELELTGPWPPYNFVPAELGSS